MNPILTIDPEFEAKCPPLTEDELSQLEENILVLCIVNQAKNRRLHRRVGSLRIP